MPVANWIPNYYNASINMSAGGSLGEAIFTDPIDIWAESWTHIWLHVNPAAAPSVSMGGKFEVRLQARFDSSDDSSWSYVLRGNDDNVLLYVKAGPFGLGATGPLPIAKPWMASFGFGEGLVSGPTPASQAYGNDRQHIPFPCPVSGFKQVRFAFWVPQSGPITTKVALTPGLIRYPVNG